MEIRNKHLHNHTHKHTQTYTHLHQLYLKPVKVDRKSATCNHIMFFLTTLTEIMHLQRVAFGKLKQKFEIKKLGNKLQQKVNIWCKLCRILFHPQYTIFYEQLGSGPSLQYCLHFQDSLGLKLPNGCFIDLSKETDFKCILVIFQHSSYCTLLVNGQSSFYEIRRPA